MITADKPLIILLLWTGMWYWSLSLYFFLQWKQFLGKCAFPLSSVYFTIKNHYHGSSFPNNIESFSQKIQIVLWTIRRHLSDISILPFKMRKSFVAVIFDAKNRKKPWKPDWMETKFLNENFCLDRKDPPGKKTP